MAALIFLVGLIVMLPVSTGILADPLWIAGIYDGADLDDIIGSIDAGTLDVPPDLRPPVHRPESLPTQETVGGPLTDRSRHQPRAPPAA